MIRIDLSAGALRNQKKYPSEYLKTLFGNHHSFSVSHCFLACLSLMSLSIIRVKISQNNQKDVKIFIFSVAFLFVLASWFLTTISLALVHERVPDRNVYGPLPDVFLDNVPAADWALDVSEILIIISTASILVLVFFHRYRYDMILSPLMTRY